MNLTKKTTVVNSGVPEEQVVPVPLVASVLLNIQSLERGNENEIVTTTNGTYPGSSVTHGIRYG